MPVVGIDRSPAHLTSLFIQIPTLAHRTGWALAADRCFPDRYGAGTHVRDVWLPAARPSCPVTATPHPRNARARLWSRRFRVPVPWPLGSFHRVAGEVRTKF